jgi:ketosteroid isomerase-like protein
MGNVEVVKEAYEKFGRGDIPSLVLLFDPRIEWRLAEGHPYSPDGKPWVGAEAITENFFMKVGPEWEGFTILPREFHDAGDTVVVECRYTGVYMLTGKSMDIQVCHVWKLGDERITSFQQYIDTGQLQRVTGIEPGPQAAV